MKRYFSTFYGYARKKTFLLGLLVTVNSLLEAATLVLLLPLFYIANLISGAMQINLPFELDFINYFPSKTYALACVVIVFLAVSVLQEYIKRQMSVLTTSIKVGFSRVLSERMYEAFAMAKWTAILGKRRSDIANALTNELKLIDIGTQTLLQFATSVPVILIQIIIAFFISPDGTIAAIIVGALFFYFLKPVNKRLGNFSQSLNDLLKDSLSDIHEHLNGIKEVKSYGAEQTHIERFSQKNRGVEEKYVDFVKLFTKSTFIYNSGTFFLLAVFVFLALTLFQENITRLIMLFIIFLRIWPMVSGFQASIQFFIIMFPAWGSFSKCLDELNTLHEDFLTEPGTKPLVIKNGIRLKDISFSYGQGNVAALKHISLDIPANSSIAVTGPSGSGKSTFADILIGLLPPAEGEVLVDGESLKPEMIPGWRKAIGFVPQETFLFQGTIRENLLWAKPGACEEELWEALKLSAADDFIKAIPEGLDSQVGDKGSNFSGGERQRIALARAVLRKPALLILDEATSSLDAENENKIRSAIQRLRGKITMVTIAHRLSTIKAADEIILLENGSITEKGTFEELIRKPSGKFAELAAEYNLK
ncbi:MAG: ABC transporter ATP-binding protein [Armatimonadota bacterium]